MLVQAGLCRTCLETTLLVFPRGGSFVVAVRHKHKTDYIHNMHIQSGKKITNLYKLIYSNLKISITLCLLNCVLFINFSLKNLNAIRNILFIFRFRNNPRVCL